MEWIQIGVFGDLSLVNTERIVADKEIIVSMKENCLLKLVELVKFKGSFLIVIG